MIQNDYLHFFKYKLVVLSGWGQWNTCSVSCGGGGTQIRTRTCDQNCDDVPNSDLTETQNCNDHVCPGKIDRKYRRCLIWLRQNDPIETDMSETRG